MEALATAYPDRFSTDCRSLARPVASCALAMTTMAKVHDSATGAAAPCGEAKGEGEENEDGLLSRSGCAVTIEERNALELWVEMLGICLLPFCGSSGGGSRTTTRSGLAGAASGDDDNSRNPSGEHDNDPFDSDEEEEEEEEGGADDDEEEGNRMSGNVKVRSRWVAGWMRRAGVTLAEPLECPFDVQPGGRDEDLPVRLATLISYRAQVSFCLRTFLALLYSLWVKRVNGLSEPPTKGTLINFCRFFRDLPLLYRCPPAFSLPNLARQFTLPRATPPSGRCRCFSARVGVLPGHRPRRPRGLYGGRRRWRGRARWHCFREPRGGRGRDVFVPPVLGGNGAGEQRAGRVRQGSPGVAQGVRAGEKREVVLCRARPCCCCCVLRT